MNPLEALSLRARRVPLLLRLPIIAAPFALLVFWIATDSGPYATIADFQTVFLDGEHYIALSGLLSLLVALVPALILIHLLATFFPAREEAK